MGQKYQKIACNLLFALLVVAAVYLLLKLAGFFMPFVVGFLFSLLVGPVVRFLEKRIRIQRRYGSAILVALLVVLAALVCYGGGVLVVGGVQDFLAVLPDQMESIKADLKGAVNQLQEMINRLPFPDVNLTDWVAQVISHLEGLKNALPAAIGKVGQMVMSLPDLVVAVLFCLLSAYFFTERRERIRAWMRLHTTRETREQAKFLYQQTLGAVGGYFKAQLKIMVVVYAVLLVGLPLVGVRYGWLIGFGIAFLDMLPVFGTGTVLIPWAAVQLLVGRYSVALGMLALYGVTFLVHQLVQPKLLGDSMGMDSFLALFFLYAGYKINNVLGMLVALPLGMVMVSMAKAGAFDDQVWSLKEIIQDLRRLGGRVEPPKKQAAEQELPKEPDKEEQ